MKRNNNELALRTKAIQLSAGFAQVSEDPMISIARAELIYDFITSSTAHRPARSAKGLRGLGEAFPVPE